MGVTEGKDCRGDRSANWVTHNGCDKKSPINQRCTESTTAEGDHEP